jgi:hypothetical protein
MNNQSISGECKKSEHFSRRALLKGSLATGAGAAVPNWGGLFHSQSIASMAQKLGKRCILLWMNGGASQIDTFDKSKPNCLATKFANTFPRLLNK